MRAQADPQGDQAMAADAPIRRAALTAVRTLQYPAPMRIGYFDCFSGVSGDMVLGALVDAGLPAAELQGAIAALGLEGVALKSEKVTRSALAATKVTVVAAEGGH